jgi:hypothetical protein
MQRCADRQKEEWGFELTGISFFFTKDTTPGGPATQNAAHGQGHQVSFFPSCAFVSFVDNQMTRSFLDRYPAQNKLVARWRAA